MSRLRHPHIVLFHREVIVRDRLAYIMEYAENGSLQRVIRSRTPLDWPLKEKITQGIVRGLAYIHSEGVIHRDLKSGNVLLTKHMEPKLCDFGLATVKDFSTTKAENETLKGAVRWMAPELFVRVPHYNTKTDIYALGWIMWELATDTTPPFWEQPEDAVVISLVKEGERLPIPSDIPSDYQQWIQKCWDQNPADRPRADEMVFMDPEPGEANDGDISLESLTSSFSADSGHTHDGELVEQVPDDMSSQFDLGMKYLAGDGVPKSELEAFYWLRQAAEQGHPEAQLQVGRLHQSGQIVVHDPHRAAFWFKKAAEQGVTKAIGQLHGTTTAGQASKNVLEIGEHIAGGAGGSVYIGRWKWQPCAIKKFKPAQNEEDAKRIQQNVENEISILQGLHHRRIIQYYGTEVLDDQLHLIMELAEGLSLAVAIRSQEKIDWDFNNRITQEVACGLAFLHSKNIIHRDIKSANILLTRHLEVKIGDFGGSRVSDISSRSESRHVGTTPWMAPELLVPQPNYTSKSDLYAFGMVMWEMAANCTVPFANRDSIEVVNAVKSGEREVIPSGTPEKFSTWIEQCWRENPLERGEAHDLIEWCDISQIKPAPVDRFMSFHDSLFASRSMYPT
ncbi:hypothetical protein DFQ26_001575 [Actinomortierella ambigua]|nr:hypothetical protein DFQ26_001575 [Actinomortierella ambigua]